MNIFLDYIRKTIDSNALGIQLSDNELKGIPIYIKYDYTLFWLTIQNKEFVFAIRNEGNEYTTELLRRQADILKDVFKKQIIFGFKNIPSINRHRMIQKKLSFIVPNKYLYLTPLFIDQRERLDKKNKISKILSPSAQAIILYHLQKMPLGNLNFKSIAHRMNYGQMSITKAAEELSGFGICQIEGTKEKRLVFPKNNKTLWDAAIDYMGNPVGKTIYVDSLPENIRFIKSNVTALSYYTDMAEGNIDFYACSSKVFSKHLKAGLFKDANGLEGRYCMELWKYDPDLLQNDNLADPLSLFLLFRESNDERIQLVLNQLLNKVKW